MPLLLLKLVGLAIVLACWMWARSAPLSEFDQGVLVWFMPLAVIPVTIFAKRALDVDPTVRRVEWTTVIAHYIVMILLGVPVFLSFRLVASSPGVTLPVPREIGLALTYVTGVITALTVINLAVRGFGAPFAAKLSSRLASDWMYAWTRNPMLLGTLTFFLSLGLLFQSLWFIVWMLVSATPPWLYFVHVYEERELEIRFGASYDEYRARTPFLWPRRPHGRRTRVAHA